MPARRSSDAGACAVGHQGLFRFEVDAVKKALTDKPTLVGQTAASAPDSINFSWLSYERSVQLDNNVYYLSGQGKLQSASW